MPAWQHVPQAALLWGLGAYSLVQFAPAERCQRKQALSSIACHHRLAVEVGGPYMAECSEGVA